ncbi:ABC transporter ATP-binding protein [Anaerolentibacter hominis]|uniref:ABC transporter ATP-binding protein n=1 Tax=Anaerolentibacter hominis TaxID=3079009 RepID=UPI0031B8205B
MSAMLELVDVTQRFGGLVAVSKLNIKVEENLITGLIGPNGAGKTTTFNVITGVYNPTEGKVFFEGKEITGKPIHEVTKCGMARTFQNIRLFKSLSVLENVKIGMHIRAKSDLFSAMFRLPRRNKAEKEINKECMKLLALTGLAGNADDRADSLPYGAQRRLEIVRAMATGARLLLLDEPAAGMNEQETAELTAFIRELKNDGYTVLLIEHDMKLVMNLCDYIYVQNQGELIASGTPAEIQSNKAVIDAYLGEEV